MLWDGENSINVLGDSKVGRSTLVNYESAEHYRNHIIYLYLYISTELPSTFFEGMDLDIWIHIKNVVVMKINVRKKNDEYEWMNENVSFYWIVPIVRVEQ